MPSQYSETIGSPCLTSTHSLIEIMMALNEGYLKPVQIFEAIAASLYPWDHNLAARQQACN